MKIFKNLSPVTLPLSLSACWIAFVIWGLFLSMETKKCSKCKDEKLKSEFYVDNGSLDKLRSSCKICSGANPPSAPISLPNEIWVDIPDYERLYMVSNFSRIKSLDRTFFDSGCMANKTIKGRILKPSLNSSGYLQVNLTKDGVSKPHRVHRIFAKVFIPNPENKPFINHKDGIKINNEIYNLEWCTPKENTNHAWGLGLGKTPDNSGAKNGQAKLTEEQVKEIISLLPHNRSSDIARQFNIGYRSIMDIRYNKTWKHITREI